MDRRVFFDSSLATPRLASADKIDFKTDVKTNVKTDVERVYIDQGQIQSAKRGESWVIWPHGILKPTPDMKITTITIDRVGAMQSSAPLKPGVQGVEEGCPATLESAVYGEDLHVVVKDTTLRQQLVNMPSIGVKFHDTAYNGAHYKIVPTGDQVHHQVIDDFGMPVPGLAVESTADKLYLSMEKLAHYMRVLELSNATGKNDLRGVFTFQVADNTTVVQNGDSIELDITNLRRL